MLKVRLYTLMRFAYLRFVTDSLQLLLLQTHFNYYYFYNYNYYYFRLLELGDLSTGEEEYYFAKEDAR